MDFRMFPGPVLPCIVLSLPPLLSHKESQEFGSAQISQKYCCVPHLILLFGRSCNGTRDQSRSPSRNQFVSRPFPFAVQVFSFDKIAQTHLSAATQAKMAHDVHPEDTFDTTFTHLRSTLRSPSVFLKAIFHSQTLRGRFVGRVPELRLSAADHSAKKGTDDRGYGN